MYKEKGFSLIELMVTISIIGLLSSIVLATFSSIRNRAYQTRTAMDIKSIQNALEIYNLSNNDYPPNNTSTGYSINYPGVPETWPSFRNLLSPYIKLPDPITSRISYNYYKANSAQKVILGITNGVTGTNVGCVFINNGYYLNFWWANDQNSLTLNDQGIDPDGIEKWLGNVRFELDSARTNCPSNTTTIVPYP